ncbi:hypothetical protein [Enterobacter phage 01_vB_Eclo_IJM]|nr:hypothetical protein [Enterobacter phage 01_vB_Eclo_IJM]
MSEKTGSVDYPNVQPLERERTMTCENGCQYAKDVGMENHSCERSWMYEPLEKTYIVELEGGFSPSKSRYTPSLWMRRH